MHAVGMVRLITAGLIALVITGCVTSMRPEPQQCIDERGIRYEENSAGLPELCNPLGCYEMTPHAQGRFLQNLVEVYCATPNE